MTQLKQLKEERMKLNWKDRLEIGNDIIDGRSTVAISMKQYGLTRGQVRYAVEYAAKCR